MKSNEIRQKFLDFFKDKGHEVVESSPLVPHNDNTLLFTNAGMVQFKELFLGIDKKSYNKATTSQRCVRAGGKHNDLENVGYTARHHTFFEMLGNFSFGDYFKKEAINYAWELLTEGLSLPKEKLWITVFEDDDEAYNIWTNDIGVPKERVSRIGAKDNFWQMGETGPCGPCTEIFYDHGPSVFGGPPGTPDEDGDRYIEIWNLVFMQYDKQADGTLTPLPKPSVDTGMGLERIAAILQGVHSNYEIDMFQNLIKATMNATGCIDLTNDSLKVIADHIRSVSFMILDGVIPSKEGRGYVLRRIIRRAIRHGYKLGKQDVFFYSLVSALCDEMGEAYPDLLKQKEYIEKTILDEENRFSKTLFDGMQLLEEDLKSLEGDTISGKTLFKLYDTYGFPVDLTADIARERNLKVDIDSYETYMNEQRKKAKQKQAFSSEEYIRTDASSEFIGYEKNKDETKILAIFVDSKEVKSLSGNEKATIILEKTPFYGESGGQAGDSGRLITQNGIFKVFDTQKQGATILHIGELLSGSIFEGDIVNAEIDTVRRMAIKRHHSSAHLLHAGLKKILGNYIEQKGSSVDENRLRFDFSFQRPLTEDEITNIGYWVNREIIENNAIHTEEMPIEKAKEKGAVALFGEKYDDVVRVLSMGDSSIELCGGTHVKRTGDIGTFVIKSESGVSAGVRRIEALAGFAALDYLEEKKRAKNLILDKLKADDCNAISKINQLIQAQKDLIKQIKILKERELKGIKEKDFKEECKNIIGYQVLAKEVDFYNTNELRELADKLRDKHHLDIVVLATKEDDKAKIVVTLGKPAKDNLHAGKIANELALLVDGRGGGRQDFAQAGGSKPEKISEALSQLEKIIKSIQNN